MAVTKIQTTPHPDRTPVAQEVLTYCTKEKTDTWHLVMHHNAKGIVEKVKCKACGSEHKYKLLNPAPPKKSATAPILIHKADGSTVRQGPTSPGREPSSKGSAKSDALEKTWFDGLKKWGDKPIVPFNSDTLFNVGEVFVHTSFGKGVVQARRENKIDVLFELGLKTLPSRKP